jgi:hypothetical protein
LRSTRLMFRWRLAPRATWSPKYLTRPASSSSSSGTRTARLHRPGQLVERDGEGPSAVMIRSRAAFATPNQVFRETKRGQPGCHCWNKKFMQQTLIYQVIGPEWNLLRREVLLPPQLAAPSSWRNSKATFRVVYRNSAGGAPSPVSIPSSVRITPASSPNLCG